MPFKSHEQEAWMKHNKPELYRKWLREHGHFKGKPKKQKSKKKGFGIYPKR